MLAAAAIAGVDEFYRVGGAQAVAALAYGTESIAPVDKIVGPGNAYVQAAKRMVYGVVDIDKMAGPSEVLVIADDQARADWVAADLIAQAEHGSGDEVGGLADSVAPARRSGRGGARSSARRSAARASGQGSRSLSAERLVVVRDLEEAFALANRIAPEHLELEIRNPARWLGEVKAAGAIFLGPMSPAPLGDYLAGPNHVLPTGGVGAVCLAAGCLRFRQANQYNPGHAGCAPPAGTNGGAAGPDGRLRGSRPRDGARLVRARVSGGGGVPRGDRESN